MHHFPPLQNDLILRVAKGEKVERVPVWVMRQAGRYLPEFREMKEKYDFFTICRTPDLATEITLQPIDRYAGLLDASIIFSDILVIPQALGMTVEMLTGKGPHFPQPLKTPADVQSLDVGASMGEKLSYVYEAITKTRHALRGRVPLIGFTGAPWTLMAYMIEGGGSKLFSKSKGWLYQYPDESHKLLRLLTDCIVEHLVGQVKAGAQMLQVFESWAGELGPEQFQEFCLPYLKEIAHRVKKELQHEGYEVVPMTVFAKGAHYAHTWLRETEYDIMSIDWTEDPKLVREKTQGRLTLQGNLDPCALFGSDASIRLATRKMLETFGCHQRTIANLGHGMHPDHHPEKLKVFLEAVHSISLELCAQK